MEMEKEIKGRCQRKNKKLQPFQVGVLPLR
jgi:hypothetical protein